MKKGIITTRIIYSFMTTLIYTIYWKVRNVGPEAVKRDCIRGQINKGIDYINETTNFYGPHFVECYIIKNDICIARDKISVDIDVD